MLFRICIKVLLCAGLCFSRVSTQRVLTITANEQLLELFINGQQQPLSNGNNPNITDTATLTSTHRLLAVTARNSFTPTCAGILASISNHFHSTDSTWKCSTTNNTDWMTLGFDDSLWSYATEYGDNTDGIVNCNQPLVADISANASWIWTNDPYTDSVVHCRANLPICKTDLPCLNGGTCLVNSEQLCLCTPQYTGTFCESEYDRVLSITASESISVLYMDGVQQDLPHANDPYIADNLTVAAFTRLIAVQSVTSIDTCNGFIGSVTGDFFVTDYRWKCSRYGAETWTQLGFNDSTWPQAFELGLNGAVSGCPNLTYIPAISSQAYWIWTQPNASERNVFCRAYLPVCQTGSPCQNGGTCLENDQELCLCPSLFGGRFCEMALNRSFHVTAKSTVYDVYLDGVKQELHYQVNWTVADTIELSPISRLVSVMAVDSTETCAGLLGSATDDYIVTNATWKCIAGAPPSWFALGFNDTDWKDAYIVGPNDNVTWPEECTILTGISSISANAYWIWTDSIPDTPYYAQSIYCRGYLPACQRSSPCRNGGTCNSNNVTICSCLVGYVGEYCDTLDTKQVSITAKETLYAAYIDGVMIDLEHGSNWEQVDQLSIYSVNRLIAVMAIQLDGPCPGILASITDSMGDYIVTDSTWKCSPFADVGWSDFGYNDFLWQAAMTIKRNEYSNDSMCQDELSEIPSISSEAYWIWTNIESGLHDVTVFCRGYLPVCNTHPCQNGGTCSRNTKDMCTCLPGYTGLHCEQAIPPTTVSSASRG